MNNNIIHSKSETIYTQKLSKFKKKISLSNPNLSIRIHSDINRILNILFIYFH